MEIYKTTISDDEMKQTLGTAKNYTIVFLKAGLRTDHPQVQSIIWEHGKRNLALRAEGVMPIICPLKDECEIKGVAILNVNKEEAKQIMDGDPAIIEGILSYEVHPIMSFPGDSLPV